MKKICTLLIFIFVTAVPAVAADGFPTSVAGFTLGADVEQYRSLCSLDEAVPESDNPYLTEAVIRPNALPGVRGGSLAYGNCKAKDRLVRIKIKFYDMNQELFDKLHNKYLAAFGKPDEYIGDAFKNVIAWLWKFENSDGQTISLVLMWSRDKELRPGVSIKMTNRTLLAAEHNCYMTKMGKGGKKKRTRIRSLDTFVPR